jgi:hypothetical protein
MTMSCLEKRYTTWLKQVNSDPKLYYDHLLDFGDLLLVCDGKYYVNTKPANDDWWCYNDMDRKDYILEPVKGCKNVSFVTNPDKKMIDYVSGDMCINVIVWDSSDIKTCFTDIAKYEEDFKCIGKHRCKNMVDMFAIPDIQSELASKFYPRHYFPIGIKNNIRWYVCVGDDAKLPRFAANMLDDSVNGVVYFKTQPEFTEEWYEEHRSI